MRYEIVFHPGWWNRHVGVCFGHEFWENPDYRIEADRAMRRTLHEKFGEFGLGDPSPAPRPLLGSDMLACGFLQSEMLGCETVYSDADAPCPLCRNLSQEDAMALEDCTLEQSEVFARVQSQIDALLKKYGRIESYIDLNGVQNVALDLRGSSLFMDYLGEEDEQAAARHVLDVSCNTIQRVAERLSSYTDCISAGVTNIVRHVCPDVFVTSNCTVEMVSQQIYEEFLLPYDARLAQRFPRFGIHHCGATAEHVAAGYAKVPNLCFFEVGAFSDLAAVRDAMPKDVLLNMRYSPVRLASVADSAIYDELAAYREIVPGKRLSVSCVGIDAAVPDARVSSFLSACKALFD